MRARGFTLVEVMVVIVVMGIVSSLLILNLSGLDRRQAMQAREVLLLDLKQINRLANEQAKVLALEMQSTHNGTLYQVLEYQPQAIDLAQKWKAFRVFQPKTLPMNMRLNITEIDQVQQSGALSNDQAPKLMWLGNGEAKPARIQVYFEEQPIGAEIEIDYLGKVHVQ